MAIRFLHVFSDDKFFDSVSDFFDALESIDNLYYFYSDNPQYRFKYIKSVEKVKVISDRKEYLSLFCSPEIDAIYFHSMDHSFYRYFKYIDEGKKVFWWSWGYDIYRPNRLVKPLIKIDLFKPLTKKFIRRESINVCKIAQFFYRVMRLPYDIYWSKRMVKRIDYYTPVLPIEYTLMKEQNRMFRAKPFMLDSGPWFLDKQPLSNHSETGNILVGHSFDYANNHFDLFDVISKFSLTDQKFIIPISYGSDYKIDKKHFRELSGLNEDKAIWLEGFLPYQEYKTLLSSVTHAIFGTMRQSAVGNINMCFLMGVKIFFYKNSLSYIQYRSLGYMVYSIEDDLTEESLKSNLSKEYALINYNKLMAVNDNKLPKAMTELSVVFR